MKIIFKCLCLSVLIHCCTAGFAQSDKLSVIDNVNLNAKKFKARQAYLSGDLPTAIRIYNEILALKPNDAEAAFHLGECFQEQGDYDQSVGYFQKAEKEDPVCDDYLHLKLGLSYQQTLKLDSAISEFNKYRELVKNNEARINESGVDQYLQQCNTAKDLMAHPVNVQVENLGVAINTAYDEKSPSVTADGKTLIFTSQRPLTKVPKDENGNDDLLDNVYISRWDSANNKWGLSYPVEGFVNSPNDKTACSSISPDGLTMFLYKNNNTDALGGDIFLSKKERSGRWGQPKPIGKPINTSYYEDCATLSPDGNTLFFISEKPGGYGNADIYSSERIDKGLWSQPVNLGPVINTAYDEGGMSMAPDGKTLFFSSTGHNSMGSYDIFKSVKNDTGSWTEPVNLGYPINSVNTDVSFSMSADTRYAYFASNRKGGLGGRDIYRVDLSSYPLLGANAGTGKPTGLSILRGKISDPKGKPIQDAAVSISDSTNVKVASLKTNSEGNYFITLKANSRYKIRVAYKGYKTSNTPVKLPSSPTGTYTMTEDITLEKN